MYKRSKKKIDKTEDGFYIFRVQKMTKEQPMLSHQPLPILLLPIPVVPLVDKIQGDKHRPEERVPYCLEGALAPLFNHPVRKDCSQNPHDCYDNPNSFHNQINLVVNYNFVEFADVTLSVNPLGFVLSYFFALMYFTHA